MWKGTHRAGVIIAITSCIYNARYAYAQGMKTRLAGMLLCVRCILLFVWSVGGVLVCVCGADRSVRFIISLYYYLIWPDEVFCRCTELFKSA